MKGHCGSWLDKLTWALVWIGALNWGLVGAFEWNLVNVLLGSWPVVEQIVYILVGLSALYMLAACGMGKCSTKK